MRESSYGNLDESSAIAERPRKGLVVWSGVIKPVFRCKLMRSPIVLTETQSSYHRRQPLELSSTSVTVFGRLSLYCGLRSHLKSFPCWLTLSWCCWHCRKAEVVSAPSTIKIPALRVPRYRLVPVDCYLSSPVTGKAPC